MALSTVDSKAIAAHFFEQGYADPIRLFSVEECRKFLRAASDSMNSPPLDWEKGQAASSRVFYEIARHPLTLEILTTLLGENIMLWGASIVTRPPGVTHAWHSDIETARCSGTTVSLWIGIENANHDSSLSVVPHSHRFGVSVQEERHRRAKSRAECTDNDILSWSRERDPRSSLVRPEITDGEGLFFDGKLWHCSENKSLNTRRALLLQYATPDAVIRIPDFNNIEWPFQTVSLPRPPCLLLRGRDNARVNRMVSAPPISRGRMSMQITKRVYPLRIPLPPDSERSWKAYHVYNGSTPGLETISCHASVLKQHQRPHPPHTHEEEEILLLLSGEVDIILPALKGALGDQSKRLQPGHCVYYPANFPHTLETISEEPANYLMFKWRKDHIDDGERGLSFGHFNLLEYLKNLQGMEGFSTHRVFEGPTAFLRKLECHVSTLSPKAGYEPHVDSHDTSIFVLEGEVETSGERVGPHGVIFYAAGEPHGLRNPGDRTAKYVVFEFHPRQTGLAEITSFADSNPSFFRKLRDPARWKRKLRKVFTRLSRG
jgi:mannose-6-phosphate isomerase-like protein (cupin superfamily)